MYNNDNTTITCFKKENSAWALLMLVILLSATDMAKAQRSASTLASITATVIEPITISKTSDMVLGKIVSDPSSATMSIASNGVRTFSNCANQTISNPNGVAASFRVTGDNGCSFSAVHTGIGAGAGLNGVFLDDGNSHTMWFAINSTGSQSLSTGIVEYQVTGTLTIPANQPAGTYSGSFIELVAYE